MIRDAEGSLCSYRIVITRHPGGNAERIGQSQGILPLRAGKFRSGQAEA